MMRVMITYTLTLKDGSQHKDRKMIVKNCMSVLHGKIKLGDYLKRKNPSFKELIITDAREDIFGDTPFGDTFRDIFR